MTPDFNPALALELALEGGATYTNKPKDPGGPTKWGISLAALSTYRGHPCTAADVQALARPEVDKIYLNQYWAVIRGSDLPLGVDLSVFDEAINAGRQRAIIHLQRALGVDDDGVFGDGTLAAVEKASQIPLIEKIREIRTTFYRSLDDFPTFGTGWLRRVNSIAATSTAWATKQASTTPS